MQAAACQTCAKYRSSHNPIPRYVNTLMDLIYLYYATYYDIHIILYNYIKTIDTDFSTLGKTKALQQSLVVEDYSTILFVVLTTGNCIERAIASRVVH